MMPTIPSRLLVFTPGFPGSECDSNCLPFPQQFFNTLKNTNPSVEIVIITLQYPYEKRRYNWKGITVYGMGGKNRGGLQRLLTWKAALKKSKELHKERSFSGILSLWLGECALLGKKAAAEFGIPHYTWLLGQDARWGNKFISRIRPEANELIALSDSIALELNKNYNIQPVKVIPMGIDPVLFPSLNNSSRPIDIIGAGSLISLKRFDIFIDIISELKKDLPGIAARIFGEGPKRNELEQMIRARGLSKNLLLAGEIPHAQLLEKMQAAKILLHPSSYEGFSTVTAEALYAGTEVISFSSPMKQVYPHHHIADSPLHMLQLTRHILQTWQPGRERILVNDMKDVCKTVGALYGF